MTVPPTVDGTLTCPLETAKSGNSRGGQLSLRGLRLALASNMGSVRKLVDAPGQSGREMGNSPFF
jgi:hypothetical protein